MNRNLTCHHDTADVRDFISIHPSNTTVSRPIDLSHRFPFPAFDQGTLGDCVINAWASVETFVRAKYGQPVDLPSRLFMYYAARKRVGLDVTKDTGLSVREGIKSLQKDGACPETDWPYLISKFADNPSDVAWTDAKKSEALVYSRVNEDGPFQIDSIITHGFPVVFAFDVYESFDTEKTATTGVMSIPEAGEKMVGRHCVVAVSNLIHGDSIPGADPTRFYRKCRNSWSPEFGIDGNFYMPMDVFHNYGSDFWTLSKMNDPNAPVAAGSPHGFLASIRNRWIELDAFLTEKGIL